MTANRLALGSAQLGMHYGIANQHGIPSDSELDGILTLARTTGINTIDTAAAYGNSEQRLGKAGISGFKTVSKFPVGGNPLESIDESLQQLRIDRLYGFMAHNADDLFRNKAVWNSLRTAEQEGKTERIGFSLYTPQQLEECLAAGFVPGLVQFPYSLLDRRFEPYFDELKKIGCEIHTRSAFLQGLYFLENIPEQLKELTPALDKLHELKNQNSLTMEELALAFVLGDSRIDRIVIGVESTQQLQANIDAAEKKLTDELRNAILNIDVANKQLLNPSKW